MSNRDGSKFSWCRHAVLACSSIFAHISFLSGWFKEFNLQEEEEEAPLHGSSSPLQHFEPAINWTQVGCMASSVPSPLTSKVSLSGIRTYCSAELAVSSLAMAITIACTYFAYPQRDDQAELAWVTWLNTKMVFLRTVTHLSTNLARRWVTLLMSWTILTLS